MEVFGNAQQEWLKTFLLLTSGISSRDTFNRVFAAIDPQPFLDCFLQRTQSVRERVSQEVVSIVATHAHQPTKTAGHYA